MHKFRVFARLPVDYQVEFQNFSGMLILNGDNIASRLLRVASHNLWDPGLRRSLRTPAKKFRKLVELGGREDEPLLLKFWGMYASWHYQIPKHYLSSQQSGCGWICEQ